MAIKIYGDKIVFPDNSEQTTAADSADTSYTKAEIDAQQDAQDVKIDKNATDLTNVYTKTEVDDSQSAQDTEIAKKVNDAPTDGETYARNNETWVSISDSSGIPDAPVDGAMYGRKDGEWDTVADAGDVYTKTETNTLLDDKADKTTTYTKTEVDAQQNAQDVNIQANADAIADLPAPVDTYTKTEIDTQQNAQDVEIAKKANTDDTYTKTQTDTLLDNKANVGDSYTKAETYNNTEIDSKLFEKADKTTTYTKDEVDASQDAQDVTISGNTSAIGALSGRVSANESDIATLQDGIFFSSSYSADYPSSPNRDPETGNMYMQNLSAFTYSYADTNQVFLSKTDEQGNVRQFTAVKPDDTIVLNQVESPNYGRYKVTSVNDLGTYVNLIVEFQIGEGTLLEGDTVALQAFPASAGGSGGIPEAPIDGKQYGRQDATWTEVTGGGEAQAPVAFNLQLTSSTTTKQGVNTPIVLDKAVVDTENGLKDGGYEVQKDGLYDISFIAKAQSSDGNLNNFYGYVYLNGTFFMQGSADPYKGGASPTGGKGFTVSGSSVLDLKKGDVITLELNANTADSADTTVPSNALSLSGHMISSFTEGSGGGETTDILPVLLSGSVNTDGTVKSGSGFVSELLETGKYKITFDTPQDSLDYIVTTGSANTSTKPSVGSSNFLQESFEVFTLNSTGTDTGSLKNGAFNFVITGTETIAVGGGSGGSYTPEKMVWKQTNDPIRTFDTVYTNDDDAPRFVNINISYYYPGASSCEFFIDGELIAGMGRTEIPDAQHSYTTQMFVIPSGSTYELKKVDQSNISQWWEANMPVAVGTGGKTVAFRGELSADQTVTSGAWTKVSLNNSSIDTDNSFADSKFQPSVAGYYQVNGSICSNCNPNSTETGSRIYKNGSMLTQGSQVASDNSNRSLTGDVIYLNGTTDYLELYGIVKSSGTCAIRGLIDSTYLSAVLVSGGSASGGGSYTPEPMVWEDKKSERGFDTEYTNTNNVPLNVIVGIQHPNSGNNQVLIKIDGKEFGYVGTQEGSVIQPTTTTFTVPSGSVYQLQSFGSNILHSWNEAKMPVALGTGDSIWTEEDGRAVYDGVVKMTRNDNTLWFNADTGNSGQKSTIEANELALEIKTNSAKSITFSPNMTEAMQITDSGELYYKLRDGSTTFRLLEDGRVWFPKVKDTITENPPNLFINSAGELIKSTATTYSTEEVDKKLAIKDKLIEKLSARLDELEKRVK